MGPAGKGWEPAGWNHLPVCSTIRSPVNTVPGSRAESLRAPVSCLWCFTDLQTSQVQTHIHHPLHRPPPRTQTPDHLPALVHTGTEQSTSGILLLHCQPVLRRDRDRTPRSPCAHQPAPAQRENLPSPPSPHMEWTTAGAAQGGLSVEARPGVASSRLTGITIGVLVMDQRHLG